MRGASEREATDFYLNPLQKGFGEEKTPRSPAL
jgi:hypothetical protein